MAVSHAVQAFPPMNTRYFCQKRMALPTIFDESVCDQLTKRILSLSPQTEALWGKMNVGQMLAHLNVSYSYVYEPEKFKPAPALLKFILKLFVKNAVVNEKPYKRGGPTSPDFIIKDDKNFEAEQKKLIAFIEKTQKLGPGYFDGKESHSFGKLSVIEWNNLFYKHLDHHLRQFGA